MKVRREKIAVIVFLFVFLSTTVLSLFPSAIHGEEETLSAADLVWVEDSVLGNTSGLVVAVDPVKLSFAKFDTSSISGDAIVDSATMTISHNAGLSSGDDLLLSVSSAASDWDPGTISGTSYPGTGVTSGTVAVSTGSGGAVSFDVTTLVEGWIEGTLANHGVVFSGDSDGTCEHVFGSPSIYVNYSLPDESAPQISGVNVTGVNSDNATITWNTDEVSTSFVDYGESTDYGYTAGQEDSVTVHTVTLVSLSPGTRYYFRVRSQDESENEAVSDDYTFETEAVKEEEVEDEEEPILEDDYEADVSIAPPQQLKGKTEKVNGEWTVVLEWKESSTEDIESYVIYRSEEDRYSYEKIGEVAESELFYSDNSVEEGNTYFYVIKSKRGEEESRDSNEFVITIIDGEEDSDEKGSRFSFWLGFAILNLLVFIILLTWYIMHTRQLSFKELIGKTLKRGKKRSKKPRS